MPVNVTGAHMVWDRWPEAELRHAGSEVRQT